MLTCYYLRARLGSLLRHEPLSAAMRRLVAGQYKATVVPPQHDSRPDLDIIFELGNRLGFKSEFFYGDQKAAWDFYLAPLD